MTHLVSFLDDFMSQKYSESIYILNFFADDVYIYQFIRGSTNKAIYGFWHGPSSNLKLVFNQPTCTSFQSNNLHRNVTSVLQKLYSQHVLSCEVLFFIINTFTNYIFL